jgi:hypothetical protein
MARSCVVISAKPIRMTVAAMMPTMIALARCSLGRPAAARPMTMALSPGQHQVDPDDLHQGNKALVGERFPFRRLHLAVCVAVAPEGALRACRANRRGSTASGAGKYFPCPAKGRDRAGGPCCPINTLYHAGNLADVHKHAVLAWVLDYLTRKDKPLTYIETHAGRGVYDLWRGEAVKTGEAARGSLAEPAVSGPGPPLPAAAGRGAGRLWPAAYPGSPLIAALGLRETDSLHLAELHPQEFARLKAARRTGARMSTSATGSTWPGADAPHPAPGADADRPQL